MALNFDQIMAASNVVSYYNNTTRDIQRHPLLALFPAKKQVGLDVTMVKGGNGNPVVLRPSAFDSAPPIRTRNSADIAQFKLPIFREELPLKEEDRQKILMYSKLGNQYLNQALADIYADSANLIDGATAQRIRMIGQALSTGSISFSAEGVSVAADYGYNAGTQTTTLSAGDLWSATSTATPIDDIIAAKKTAKLGSCVAYMTSQTFNEMLATAQVKNTVYGSSYAGIILGSDVKAWFARQISVAIVVLDEFISQNSYDNEGGTTDQAFFPDGVVTLAPQSALGNMTFGTTPEEADLMAGIGNVKGIEIVDTGVAVVSTIDYKGFVKVATTVSQVVIPSFEAVGKIHIINV
jgi:hypothetical protein